MYAIGNLMFGIDVTDAVTGRGDDLGELFEDEEYPGLYSDYNGGGDTPYAVGVYLKRFNECSSVCVNDWRAFFDNEDELRRQYAELVKGLPLEVQELAEGKEPAFIIMWSTS